MPLASRSIFVALLAGGRGTRFWPLSRRLRPKQLLDVTGEGPLLTLTRDRVSALCPAGNVLLVTSSELASASRALLGLPARNVLREPVGRNTAAAVGLALAVAAARDEDAVLLALPADHHVARPAALRRALARAARAAHALQSPVLLGLAPESPSGDFGYVVPGRAAGGGVRRVERFVEKPEPSRARRLIAGGALWNSGMFVLPARATLELIRELMPPLSRALDALPVRRGAAALASAVEREWPRLPSVSFDVGVLERCGTAHVLPAPGLGWSDVGSWEAVAAMMPPDARGNRSRGPAYFFDSEDCVTFQHDSSRTLVVLGARDLALLDAGDVILAAPRSKLPRLRELVAELDRERPELT